MDRAAEFERELVCSMCGKTLLLDENTRYEVRIDVRVAADVMEVSREEVERDHREDLKRLFARAAEMDEEELANGVYKRFTFFLCPPCQKAYLKNPLPEP